MQRRSEQASNYKQTTRSGEWNYNLSYDQRLKSKLKRFPFSISKIQASVWNFKQSYTSPAELGSAVLGNASALTSLML